MMAKRTKVEYTAEHLEGERLVWRDCALRFEALIVRLAEARRAMRNAQSKPAYLDGSLQEFPQEASR